MTPGATAYQSSKGAVRLMAKSCAVDLAPFKIRVNSVHPGVIDTPMTKDLLTQPEFRSAAVAMTLTGRPARPEEVSQAVLFLASDESRFVTGSDLTRRVALRPPGELRWFLWQPGTGAVLDEAGRVKLVAQTKAARWTTVELIPYFLKSRGLLNRTQSCLNGKSSRETVIGLGV